MDPKSENVYRFTGPPLISIPRLDVHPRARSEKGIVGAILGDGVQTGINASINAGSLIGSGTFIGPGAVASGVILPDSRIF